jgi:galactokinase
MSAAEGPVRERVVAAFVRKWKEEPELLVRAPGRVNLIGEHTDYNDGFVLPMAIERAIWIALRRRPDTTISVHSLDYARSQSFDALRPKRGKGGWIEYVKGTAWALSEHGCRIAGWEGVMGGDVPIGAGLSSSAALELATARAITAVANGIWNPSEMARLCQRAENGWVGVQCGIMDQMISATGRHGNAVLIDCRTLETTLVPLPEDVLVVILDTSTRRELAGSAYNDRRAQCEVAADHFRVPALRDLSIEEFEAGVEGLDPVTARRGRHVVSENARALAAAEVMQSGDARRLGELMSESHRSLREDFEVSSEALDAMVELAREHPACLGARMTGAGFGGCAVAIVNRDAAGDFATWVADRYRQRTRLEPKVYVTGATAGAEVVAGDG